MGKCEELHLQKLVEDAHNQSETAFMILLCFIALVLASVIIGYFEDVKRGK